MPKEFKSVQEAISVTSPTVRSIPRVAFRTITKESKAIKSTIQKRYYSGHGPKSLGKKSGEAREGWTVRHYPKTTSSVITNPVAHADHSRVKNIKPKSGSFLAIPIGPAVDSKGKPKFKGPKETGMKFSMAKLRKGKGFLLLANMPSTQASKVPWFILKDEVKVPARTKGVTPFFRAKGLPLKLKIEANIRTHLANLSRA